LSVELPAWAEEVRAAFRSGSASQFVLYGNVFDLVPAPPAAGANRTTAAKTGAGTEESWAAKPGGTDSAAVPGEAGPEAAADAAAAEDAVPDDDLPDETAGGSRYLPLRRFLTEVMLEPFDAVLCYDAGRGIRAVKGADHFQGFLRAFDAFRGTAWSGLPSGASEAPLDLANQLPRDPRRALELLDRFLRASRHRTLPAVATTGGGEAAAAARVPAPLRVAVLVDYAHFIAPQGEALNLGERSQSLIKLLDWASDPAITTAPVATFLITENLTDLNRLLVESPYSAKVEIGLPGAAGIRRYVDHLVAGRSEVEAGIAGSEVGLDQLAEKLVGLSLVNVRGVVLRALSAGRPITRKYLTRVKKELIEKEVFGRVEFLESSRTLDDVAGHAEAKAWLRQDAELLRRNRLRAIPMGYLLCGRIGTGKTFLVECWAGEIGVPVVELKNFRERWVGATEGNLERIFTILRALGQVVVFIDEADQMTGKRDSGSSDSGLSGRVYGMLAAQMSDTANRGRILWVFATSRPDLLEVDLKRQGRLDVHIPLFPPGDAASRKELFAAMARKVGLDLPADELPTLPDDHGIGGNEMEGMLVRALRTWETRPDDDPRTLAEVVAAAIADFRPSAHGERLELMDLLAVKECTDTRFLPDRFRDLALSDVNRRIEALRLLLGE